MKKRIIVLGASLMFCLSLASCTESNMTVKNSNNEDVVLSLANRSKVYFSGSLFEYEKINTYNLAGHNDVPYISARDYYKIMGYMSDAKIENGKEVLTNNNATITIDPTNDTISVVDYYDFFYKNQNCKHDQIIVSQFTKHINTLSDYVSESVDFTLNLGTYGFDIVMGNDTCYLPFYPVSLLLSNERASYQFAYNGSDYFNDPANYDTNSLYYSYYESGSLSYGMSEEYSDYAYKSLCLLYDNFLGTKEEYGINTFDEYFTSNKYKSGLTSNSITTFSRTLDSFVNHDIDTGHDYIDGISAFSSLYSSASNGKHTKTMQTTKSTLSSYRRLSETENNQALISKSKETVVITFDSFEVYEKDNEIDYYTNKQTRDSSTFGLLSNTFDSLKNYTSVKNVVFDLSLNGGGNVDAIVDVMAFISPNATIAMEYTAFGHYTKYSYQVDTNLDGVFNSDDSYYGKYNFYILASNYTYSSANTVTFYSSVNNVAKIIGQSPSGGTSCVFETYLPSGDCLKYSGTYCLGAKINGNFVNTDTNISVDIPLNYSDYYSPTKIERAINNYNLTL